MLMVARNLFFAVVFSTMLAIILSFLPTMELSQNGSSDIPVFQSKETVLTKSNLVDFLRGQSFQHPIRRVKWENGSLFIDFYITSPKQLNKKVVFDDFSKVLNMSFYSTTNVKQVFIRLINLSSESPRETMMVALSGDRENVRLVRKIPSKSDELKIFLETYFRLSYGQDWIKIN
ncbi:hypothetical protein L1765_15355 [Microaerobacter geothermalis]|nr:hypothetical protein [Microaerobacter geothermalis]